MDRRPSSPDYFHRSTRRGSLRDSSRSRRDSSRGGRSKSDSREDYDLYNDLPAAVAHNNSINIKKIDKQNGGSANGSIKKNKTRNRRNSRSRSFSHDSSSRRRRQAPAPLVQPSDQQAKRRGGRKGSRSGSYNSGNQQAPSPSRRDKNNVERHGKRRRCLRSYSSNGRGDDGEDGDVSSDGAPYSPSPEYQRENSFPRKRTRGTRGRGRRKKTGDAAEQQQQQPQPQQKTKQGRRKRRKRRRAARRSSSRDTQVLDEKDSPVRGIVSVEEDTGQKQAGQVKEAAASKRADGRSSSFHDDTVGHFQGGPGTMIADRYQIIKQVGIGTFGRVLECIDLRFPGSAAVAAAVASGAQTASRNQRYDYQGQPPQQQQQPYFNLRSPPRDDRVAIKVVRDVKRYYDSALIEAGIIADVNRRGGRGLTHCVVMHEAFSFGGHYCMVFESLGPSLYDFLKRHHYQPFPIICVQDFTVQLLETLEFLHSFRLIHTDLKIENILLMNDREVNFANQRVPESTRIKVIDFGGACYDTDKKSSIINTRQYRAPEVMLGTGWSMPSDIWSLGCILAELYQGELLFATHDNIEHLALIETMVGPFPKHLLKRARTTNSQLVTRAFDSNGRHRIEAVLPPDSASFVRKSRSLDSIVRARSDSWFRDLLRRILVIDPEERSTAHECLQYLVRIRKDFVRNA